MSARLLQYSHTFVGTNAMLCQARARSATLRSANQTGQEQLAIEHTAQRYRGKCVLAGAPRR